MLPVGKNYFISADSNYANYFIYDARNKTYFNVSNRELDELYKVFYDNEFGNILTFEEMVYDRGGNSVSISWKGERINVSNSGISFIEKKWQKEYSAIVSALKDLISSKIEDIKVNFTLRIDTSIINLKKTTNITIDDDFTYYSARDGVKDNVGLRLLPGEHNFRVYLLNKGGKPGTFAGNHFVLEVEEDMNDVTLYIDGKEILLK
jgi:hypothetical protein